MPYKKERKKTGRQTGFSYNAMFPSDVVKNLRKIASLEERSITSQIRYFVKKGIEPYIENRLIGSDDE